MIALTAMVTCGLVTAQVADTTLALACEGTVKEDIKLNPIPVSMGIIINFSDRTIKGFGVPGIDTVEITSVTETSFRFGTPIRSDPAWTATGSIDRVTGNLEATTAKWDASNTHNILAVSRYALKCRPTQRMF
jgi:hypothetical protein